MDLDNTIVIAFDPGSTTGYAGWGRNGLLFSGQGTPQDACADVHTHLLKYKNPEVHMVIEDVFVGVNKLSALHTAKIHGYIAGKMGFSPFDDFYAPMARSWRAAMGFPQDKASAEARALKFASAHTDQPLPEKNIHQAEAIVMASYGWEMVVED